MSYILTTVTVKASADTKFIRELAKNTKLRRQASAVYELKKLAEGFDGRDKVTLSEDGLTMIVVEKWATREAYLAFKAANTEALDAWRQVAVDYNAANGISSTTATTTV